MHQLKHSSVARKGVAFCTFFVAKQSKRLYLCHFLTVIPHGSYLCFVTFLNKYSTKLGFIWNQAFFLFQIVKICILNIVYDPKNTQQSMYAWRAITRLRNFISCFNLYTSMIIIIWTGNYKFLKDYCCLNCISFCL